MPEWTALLHGFVQTYALSDHVMTLHELSNSDDVRGTGMDNVCEEVWMGLVVTELHVDEGLCPL